MVLLGRRISLSILVALGTCVKSEISSSSRYVIFHRELATVDEETSPVPLTDSLNVLEPKQILTLIIYSPFDVTILSSNGTDLTSSIQVLHSHAPLSALQQRSSTSSPIRECPMDPEHVSTSWCQRSHSAQDFRTSCLAIPQPDQGKPNSVTRLAPGKCPADGICIGRGSDDETETPVQAYCVSTNDFVKIGQEPLRGGQNLGSSGVVAAGLNPAFYNKSGGKIGVEAVVTYMSGKESLFAASMVMQAQTYDTSWRTVANGSANCLRCSSVTVAPFPMTAQRVKVDVVMPERIPTGLLWLASYPI